MNTVKTLPELRIVRGALSEPVGLVPTMGYLHDGHLSLVRQARQECSSVVVSIFVNPSQFGPKEDFTAYPRDVSGDLARLESVGVDLVWMPEVEDMYPAGYQTWVIVEEVAQPLEGSMRPGHFRGVATVVTKLFNAVQPQKAYFGQKDAQQVAVIRRMTEDLNLDVDIVVCPIRREADGLAMSSRNTYLSPDERIAARVLYRALTAAQQAFLKGERSGDRLKDIMKEVLAEEPLAKTQYVSCADIDSLQELTTITHNAILSMAVYVGKTRLIDNIVLGSIT
jgi:pantoate--beta-alanine ligase